MPKADDVKASVKAFAAINPVASTEPDSFAPWYLHKRFKLSAMDAAYGAPGGNHDYGIDAFFLEQGKGTPTLHLIQAKYGAEKAKVKNAFAEFRRILEPLRCFLNGIPFDPGILNPVVTNLAAKIDKLRNEHPEQAASLAITFVVIHLCDEERESIDSHCRSALEKLTEDIRAKFGEAYDDHAIDWLQELPEGYVKGGSLVVPKSTSFSVRFHGQPQPMQDGVTHLSGFGYLADMVGLYQHFREALFARNVRYFLANKAEKGPSKHIRDTLRRICVPKGKSLFESVPEEFALYHNGITLYASSAKLNGDTVELRDPSVINGCQTIKSAFIFRHADGNTSKQIEEDRWSAVAVPIRIVVTSDEALIRRITVGLNRQNVIRPAAFRSNDPEQIRLQQRFAEHGIYYERQERAFANEQASAPQKTQELYPNSPSAPITMEELAQAIGAAAQKPAMSVLSNVGDLFEDALYQQIFAEKRLENIHRLVFLRNVFACSPHVARDLKGKSAALKPLQPGKFRYIIARVCARWALDRQLPEVEDYGYMVEKKFGPNHPLRKAMLKWCGPAHTKLQLNIPSLWAIDQEKWLSPNDGDAIQKLLTFAAVANIDVFA